jgi:glycogen debranching enzyme
MIPQNYVHVRRRQLLDGELVEQIVLTNYIQQAVSLTLRIGFAADFADIFEVRGARRVARGVSVDPRVGEDQVELGYRGLCGRHYSSTVVFAPPPHQLGPDCAVYRVALAAAEAMVLEIRVRPARSDASVRARTAGRSSGDAIRDVRRRAADFRRESTRIRCDNGMLQAFLDQATSDLHALRVSIGDGNVLAAGIPWFCCPFGRDTLLASYEALLLNPDLAASSLRVLAAYQGRRFDPVSEEEPGKIFHELRFGEMAAAGEMPHSPYYGSIDATPLFVVVADAHHRATGDLSLTRELSGAIDGALTWIDTRTKLATELVTYERTSPRGLENQGWKDSRAGVSFPDGRPAASPIALCEVQGYCMDAYARGARLLRALGESDRAKAYEDRARRFRDLIEAELWLSDQGRYAFAIDGRGAKLPTVVSNVGHLLWSRVPSPERAAATATLLVSKPSLSSFGVRTLASGQPVYNPLSYHNGTVWPHDNALIAKGMANYGLMREACAVFESLVAALPTFRDYRLPELFCGLDASESSGLVRYPVACSPQAWASAAPFLLLQALLGLHLDGPRQQLVIKNPILPRCMKRIEIDGLRVGRSRISLRVRRVGKRCHVDRLDVEGAPLRTEVVLE